MRATLCDSESFERRNLSPGVRRRRGCRRVSVALVATLALLAGCARGSSTDIRGGVSTRLAPSAPSVTLAPRFPAFSDWRVAYIGRDGNLHLVSLDGQKDLAGVQLPIAGPPNTGVCAAGTAPDGEHLAYCDAGGIEYIAVNTDTLSSIRTAYTGATTDEGIIWAPSGHALATGAIGRGSAIVQLPSGTVTLAPPINQDAQGNTITGLAYGWIDSAHLAVLDSAAAPAATALPGQQVAPDTSASLGRLDVTTGQLQLIATVSSPTLVSGNYSLTPDGSEALFFNSDEQSFPFTPIVRRIDTASGQVTTLPHLTSILPKYGGFTQVLWLPHSHKALAATGYPENGDVRYQIIDIDQDTSTPISLPAFPVAWAPDGKTLILAHDTPLIPKGQGSNGGGDGEASQVLGFNDIGVVDSGPYVLTAVSFDANWNIANSVTLTTTATHIPVLGFVHNP